MDWGEREWQWEEEKREVTGLSVSLERAGDREIHTSGDNTLALNVRCLFEECEVAYDWIGEEG